ncbi:hypothetical protein EXIGLDRAFT_232822 [Exidia glandulosa HHB12029]|uniref:Uncharacterized protein n=1 Tax=Exidia glandulosa HHB12029 TaxID=1314781 RepID=A0A165E3W0_EXIGL|nr:hypothetical protein EXIGLDRAFT_232822 [Exidia glandulosa HHB12029]
MSRLHAPPSGCCPRRVCTTRAASLRSSFSVLRTFALFHPCPVVSCLTHHPLATMVKSVSLIFVIGFAFLFKLEKYSLRLVLVRRCLARPRFLSFYASTFRFVGAGLLYPSCPRTHPPALYGCTWCSRRHSYALCHLRCG